MGVKDDIRVTQEEGSHACDVHAGDGSREWLALWCPAATSRGAARQVCRQEGQYGVRIPSPSERGAVAAKSTSAWHVVRACGGQRALCISLATLSLVASPLVSRGFWLQRLGNAWLLLPSLRLFLSPF